MFLFLFFFLLFWFVCINIFKDHLVLVYLYTTHWFSCWCPLITRLFALHSKSQLPSFDLEPCFLLFCFLLFFSNGSRLLIRRPTVKRTFKKFACLFVCLFVFLEWGSAYTTCRCAPKNIIRNKPASSPDDISRKRTGGIWNKLTWGSTCDPEIFLKLGPH